MKKRIISFALVVAMLLLGISMVRATPIDDLTTLADYYPEDTAAFAVIRTDPGYIETLDGVVNQILSQVAASDMEMEEIDLASLLDLFALNIFGQPYQDGIDQWLGDSIALGLFDVAGIIDATEEGEELDPADAPFLLTVQVSDADAAEAALFGEDGLMLPPTFTYAFDEDVLLIGPETFVDQAVAGFDATLASTKNFTDSIASFPAEGYNVFAYIDLENIIDPVLAALEEEMMDMGDGFDLSQLEQAGAVNALSIGLTITEGRNFIMDMVAVQDEEMVMDMMNMDIGTIDPDFAQYIPAYAQLVIHNTNFNATYNAGFEALSEFGSMLQEQIEMAQEQGEDIPLDLSVIDFGALAEFPQTVIFAGMTGMNLQEDVLSWMTGDYAIHASLYPVESDLDFTFDMGVLFEVTDAEAAANVVEQTGVSLENYEVMFGEEEIGGGNAINLPNLIRQFFPPEFESAIADTPELDFLFAVNDEVYAIGSRPSVVAALEPGDSIADTEEFQYAAGLLVENPNTVWYVSSPAIRAALPALEEVADSPNDLQGLNTILGLLESATISGAMTDTGGILRLTLTLEDDPVEPLDIAPAQEMMPPTMAPTAMPTEMPTTTPTEAMEATAEATLELEVTAEPIPDMEMTAEATPEMEATEEADVEEPAATEEAEGN